jgi:hypothetical protein
MATIRAKTSHKAIDDNFWRVGLQREPDRQIIPDQL